jgi:predicted signal transduction protein with EAL and GGDEF domain
MILEGIHHVDEAVMVVERILKAINAPIQIQQDEVVTSASIGITVYPFDDVEIEHLMSNADAAMYRAKEQGRNNYVFYTADMNTSNTEKLAMERKLRKALNEDEYQLHYQPIVDLRTGTVFASEALLRWDSKEYGLVSPGRFIPILEDSGMIGIVGEWVLKTACRKNREWQEMGYPPIQVSVNVSLCQFRQMNFVDTVREALDEVGLDPKYLKLELTESMLMDSTDASVRKLEALRALGVSIAADDFGTGYSSLSYLKRLPIDTLKIDRSFVTDVHKSSDSAAIVTAIIALAYSLRLNVIAEGVEEIQEMNFISALGCHLIQGFYFSKPLTESDFIALLADPGILQEKLNAIRTRNQSAFAS